LASSSAQVGNYTVSANIVVPSAATTGLTRMRVVNVETSYMFLSSVTPCGTYFWGETEDYMVQIGAPNTYSCVSGTVFCDIDTNGIYNGSDMFLDSVPVSFNYNGQSQFISTAANGTYSFVFPLDSLVTSATVSLDTAWLAQNGVIASPFSISTTQLVCNTSSSQLNFPVNCDALIIAGNCTSPFLAGNVVSSVINACPDVDFDLTLSGGSPGNGITYQWQISPDSLTFTNIAGATNDTFLGMQSTGMYYRCIAICTNTYFDTSGIVYVGMNHFTNCYCTSQANFTADEDIFNVSLANLNNSSNCSSAGAAGSVLNGYSDYTAISPVILAQGGVYPMSVSIESCSASVFSSLVKVWIDFNQNGLFTNPGELILVSPNTGVGAHTVSGNINVPSSALQGLTRMRVVNVETTLLSFVNSCGTYTWGETEDYMVQIGAPNSTSCLNGNVFCDINKNEVLDSLDIPLSSVPVILTHNGQNQVVLSDNNGNYSFTFLSNNLTSNATVSLDASWLAQNGIQFGLSTYTTSQLACSSSNTPINFPLNCDSSNIQSSCAIGWVYCDSNANGILDNYEMVFANAPIQLSNGITVYTDSNGMFSFSGGQNSNGVLVASLSANWLSQNSYSLTNNSITFSTNCDNMEPIYFGIECSGANSTDLWSGITPWQGYHQNQSNELKMTWGNNNGLALSGYTLLLTYPAGLVPDLNSIDNSNYVHSGNNIIWTFGPGFANSSKYDVIAFFIPSGLPSSQEHIFSTKISSLGGANDSDTLNNESRLCLILDNNYDTNDKTVSNSRILKPNVQDELTYVIRFQNTDSSLYQNIYIIDTLSTNLDWSTLKIIYTSHNLQLIDLGNGVMKFNFPGIWLLDSTSNESESYGEVVFSVKENANNGNGTTILNTGFIYFDWNAPIKTNTTINTNAFLGLEDISVNEIVVSPNPFDNKIAISSTKRIDNITIVDITGKIVFEIDNKGYNTTIELESLNPGLYLIQVKSGTEISTKRIVKK